MVLSKERIEEVEEILRGSDIRALRANNTASLKAGWLWRGRGFAHPLRYSQSLVTPPPLVAGEVGDQEQPWKYIARKSKMSCTLTTPEWLMSASGAAAK